MDDTKETIGLQIIAGLEHGFWRMKVVPLLRRGDESHPVNPSWRAVGDCATGKMLEDLELTASMSESFGYFHLEPPAYVRPYRVRPARCKAMLATLTKLDNAITKADASEVGDVFMAFAKAIGAQWVCEADGGNCPGYYSHSTWRWHPLTWGRDKVRSLKAEQRKIWKESNPGKELPRDC